MITHEELQIIFEAKERAAETMQPDLEKSPRADARVADAGRLPSPGVKTDFK